MVTPRYVLRTLEHFGAVTKPHGKLFGNGSWFNLCRGLGMRYLLCSLHQSRFHIWASLVQLEQPTSII